MTALIIFAFILLVGPLSVRYGADSRRDDAAWFGRRGSRPTRDC